MTPKHQIIKELEELLRLKLAPESGKRIIYSGRDKSGNTIIVCTPESKLHKGGFGWVDLTVVQYELMRKAAKSIVVFRLENDNNYYLEYNTLAPLLTPEAMVVNYREGEHWKLRIWPDFIEVIGNDKHLPIRPNQLNTISQ